MGTKVTRLLLAVATILSLAASACDGVPPTGPTPSTTPSPTPSPTTYRVAGYVLEEGGAPVAGANVWVDSAPEGPPYRLQETNADGFFSFDLEVGDTLFDVAKEGYERSSRRVPVTSNLSLTFHLRALRRFDAEGTYSLTIFSDAACRNMLPEAAWTPTYIAELTKQESPWTFAVLLSGADFLVDRFGRHNVFGGEVRPNGLSFFLSRFQADLYGDYADLIERLTPSTALVIDGDAVTTPTETGFAGKLRGWFTIVPIVDNDTPVFYDTNNCYSNEHWFVLSRRSGTQGGAGRVLNRLSAPQRERRR